MHPVLRDGWATLYRWHEAGERVWRIEGDAEPPDLPDDLPLASAPVHAAALCYSGPDRAEWIVVARHGAEEPIVIHGEQRFAYPEAMISYLTTHDSTLAAGVLNLEEQPTWADIYLPAGKAGNRWLGHEEVDEERERLFRAMRHWYHSPTTVV